MKSKKSDMDSRPSLVSQFDDLMRKSKILQAGCESEFMAFALNQDEIRQKWLAAEQKNDSLGDKLKHAEQQASTLDTQLKHARVQAEYELQRRKTAEIDKADMDRQLEVIRELLSDKNSKSVLHENDRERLAAFTNSQRLSSHIEPYNASRLNTIMEKSASFLSDVSYDKTEEDVLGQSRLRNGKNWKRNSELPDEFEDHTPPKRHRKMDTDLNSSVVTATITIDAAGKPSASVETNIPKLNKSFSEPALDKHGNLKEDCEVESEDDVWGNVNINNRNYKTNPRKSILKNTPETPALRKANSAGRGLNRVHIFVSKTILRPETCVPCGRRIRFSKPAMKCKDCRAVCHPECKDKLPLPCIPSCPSTPGNRQLSEGLISDFAPSERPMIPRLVVNCANEIEVRGLEEVGLYRVPGSDREQKELKEKFLKGRYPNLSNIHDIHVICGCLKDFLRGLKEPLVTYALWSKFVQISNIGSTEKCREEYMNLIPQLPQANQDTLAFLLQHLQTVGRSVACKMPTTNLSKIFGPTVVGYSSPEPNATQIMGEIQKQCKVMLCLLEMPAEYWSDLLCVDDMSLFPVGTPRTPGSPYHLPPRSMLGPVSTPDMPEEYALEVTHNSSRWKGSQTPSCPNLPEAGTSVTNKPQYASKTREPKKANRFFASPLVN